MTGGLADDKKDAEKPRTIIPVWGAAVLGGADPFHGVFQVYDTSNGPGLNYYQGPEHSIHTRF